MTLWEKQFDRFAQELLRYRDLHKLVTIGNSNTEYVSEEVKQNGQIYSLKSVELVTHLRFHLLSLPYTSLAILACERGNVW